MSQVINTNLASVGAQRNLAAAQGSLATSLQRLSSGIRINSAKDDAAGQAISERFSAQIRGMDQARRNANDGVSLAQTAEGAISQMNNLLQRIRELAVQAGNGTNSTSDRQATQAEVSQLVSELDRFAQTTEFNGQKLLDGSFASAAFQVGANARQTITATTGNYRVDQYGTHELVSVGVPLNDVGTNIYQASSLTIAGAQGSGTIAITTTDSAKSIAEKINGLSQTGVKATARTEVDIAFTAGNAYHFNLTGTNSTAVTVSFTAGGNHASGLSAAIEAFNNVSAKTGVTATLNQAGTGVTLTAADGSTITLKETAAAPPNFTISTTDGAQFHFHNQTSLTYSTQTVFIGGRITLESAASFTSTENAVGFEGGVMLESGGSTVSALQAVQTLDVSTAAGAQKAIRIVDGAIQRLNSQQATFGALQSRFQATISSLQTSSENMSAARSRIRDADFAAETAALTRSQVLQQAGVAMLAQANTLPSNVLSLLR